MEKELGAFPNDCLCSPPTRDMVGLLDPQFETDWHLEEKSGPGARLTQPPRNHQMLLSVSVPVCVSRAIFHLYVPVTNI
jgi:hypothetical protein